MNSNRLCGPADVTEIKCCATSRPSAIVLSQLDPGVPALEIPHKFRGLWSSRRLLVMAIVVLFAAHVGVASIRHPVGPHSGTKVSGISHEHPAPEGVLRVATYNIRRGKGLDGSRDLSRIQENLENLDLVGLNEVGGDWFGNQAAALGEGLQMGHLFAPAQRRWYSDYFGNGFLTGIPPTAWQSQPIIYDLDKGTGHRNIVYVELTWQGEPFTVMVVHAERGDIRNKQIRHFFDEFSERERAILLGDLNAAPDEPIMQSMTEIYDVASPTGPGQVDWIFVRGFDVLENGSIPAGASDHPLMWASLALGNAD
jgi:endonuclease/exonuclease/phosphatase family metal-dependent hydrolase